MYYVKNGLGKGWQWVGILFCIFAAIAAFGIGNMSQVNSIVGSINNAVDAFIPSAAAERGTLNLILGIVLAVLVGVILFGGIKRIGAVAEKLVPAMALLYIVFGLTVIVVHAGNIIPAFGKIFSTAFNPQAIGGAAAGIVLKETIVWGLRRSAFSNEAGLGSAAIAHSAADTPGPVQQGMYGIFECFADTIVICSLTALTIICSGVEIPFGVKPGSELITAAFATVFGDKIASTFVAVALTLFAFTTILGWSLYGSRCFQYLFGLKAASVYKALYVVIIVVGAVSSIDVVWDISDTFNGLMAVPNHNRERSVCMQEERFEVFFQNISGLYRAVQRLRAQFAQMSGVSSVHLFWLYLLREYPEGLAASRLAELSNIDRSLVSRQLKPLLARGLVQTGEQTGKRRYGWKIRLTQEGIALAEEIAAQALAIQNHAGRGVSAEELAVFYRVLGALNRNFSEISISGGSHEAGTDSD